jgi:hypothetical protein
MNYKITCHLMPWELDYALLSFTQLKKSKYYLNNDDKVHIDVTLNLSSYLINWNKTKIPKKFFINKFKNLQPLLKDYICKFNIYDSNELFGSLNTQLESTQDHIDHYIILNPDIYFSENLLGYLIEGSKNVKNEYFTITPQTVKLWDHTWDSITHPHYMDVDYKEWKNVDAFDVRHYLKTSNNEPYLTSLNIHKWAGWMDLYSKGTWDNFWVNNKDWEGYGACDLYSMLLSQYAKNQGVDFQQYVLNNLIICEYEFGPLQNGNLSKHYKDMVVLNDIPDQRKNFDSKIPEYLNKGAQNLKNKNII